MNVRIGKLIRSKAASQSGASILIALAFVLVCTVIAVIVLSSASVNAERLKGYEAEQQEYLDKVSALNMVQAIVVGDPEKSIQGISIEETAGGGASLFSPTGKLDDLGIAQWLCDRLNSVAVSERYKLTIDASSLDRLSSAKVGSMVVELSFDGANIRARAYKQGQPTANVTREFYGKSQNGIMKWHILESS